MATVLLLNGPNLNMLGSREPEIYGHATLPQIEESVRSMIEGAGHAFRCFQSNSEGALVTWLQENAAADFLLCNAASYTHTSLALRDGIKFAGMPFIEVHISNIYRREAFRHHSYLADIAVGSIAGLGPMGYTLAAQYALDHLKNQTPKG